MENQNPWQQISLDAYEGHMGWADVQQLQALNELMKRQWQACPHANSAAILGVAGGNGLEHCGRKVERIYGIDINEEYLEACRKRYGKTLGSRLVLLQMDISQKRVQLPQADLLIANLVVEYIGPEIFCRKAAASKAAFISCVVQAPACAGFVSASPYQAELQALDSLHCDVDLEVLREIFAEYKYEEALREVIRLPNGKELVRADYKFWG